MNKYIEIIKLLERIFGKSAVSKSIGTRTNVTRFPKGPQGLDPTTRHFDVEGTAQKTPELVDTIKNSVGDRMGDLTKMNDQEFLTYKQNVQRLADHVDPPSADIIAAGSKQRVTGEGIEALKETAGQTNRPGTTIGNIESRINKLKQLGQEMEKTTGKKANITDVLNDFGASQQSMSRMKDVGLVRATAREILINDIKAGKIKNITVSEAINMKEPIDPFRQIYGEGALEQLDSLIPNLRNLKTEAEAEKLARSKFKFEPDEARLPGSVSIEEGKKAEQEFGINRPQQTKVTNITAKVNKNRDPDILIEEYNKNNQRLSLTDEEGGTLIGYQEFQKLQDRNKEIESILDSFGIKSAEEIKPEGIVIPFRKKITEPENKADGGSIGLDYLMGFNNRSNYKKGGRVGYADGGTEPSFYDYFSSADKTKPISYGDKTYNPISSYQGKDYGIGLNRWTAKPMYASNFNPNNRFDLYGNVDPFLPFGYEGNAFYLNELPEDFFSTGMSTPTTTEIPTVDPFSLSYDPNDPESFVKFENAYDKSRGWEGSHNPAQTKDLMDAYNQWKDQSSNIPTIDPFSGQQVLAQDQAAFTQPQAEIFPQQELPTVAPIPNKPIDPSMWQQFSNYLQTNAGIPAITALEMQNYMNPQKGYTDTAEGFASDIRHGTATSQVRDRIADFLTGNANSIDSNYQPGSRAKFLGSLGANLLGLIREPDLLNFTNPSARAAAVEDVKANYRGAPIFGTPTVPYGQTVSQTYSQLQNKNDPILKTLGENLNNLSYEDIKNIRNTKRQDLVSAATQTMKKGGKVKKQKNKNGLNYLLGF